MRNKKAPNQRYRPEGRVYNVVLNPRYEFAAITGQAPPMSAGLGQVGKVADSNY